jgi:hypothetical protein
MAKYEIVAYPDEEGNKRQEAVIEARDYNDAINKAWKMFPEHHEVGAYEMKGE